MYSNRSFTLATANDQFLIFYGNRVDDIRIQGEVVNTLQARMGTGGGNMPIAAYSLREDAKANTFSATETDTALALQGLQPSPQSHHAQLFLAQEQVVRRLTPTECERLQGFPEIKKCATFILCLDHQKNPALAGIQNLKWQRFVGSAGNDRLNEIAWSAVNDLSSENLQISKPAQILVRINYEAKRVEILSLGKLLWSANNVESQNLLALPIKTGDFVQASVGLMQIAEQITIGGEVELRQNAEKTLIGVTHGNYAEKQFGNETEPPANAVNSSLTEPLSDTMFTTLPLTDLQSLEQNLQTLLCFVKPVIDGFIPTQTDQKSLLTFQIESVEGWTADQADTHRYKQMGNAVAVPVVEWIIGRLVNHIGN